MSISTTTMSDHVQAWRTEMHAVKTARGEPVYEVRPRYEMQPAVLSSDGHVIWVNDYPWEGAGENEAHAAAISEYMNKYCDEHGVFPIWGPTRLNRLVGYDCVQVGTTHHPAVTETVARCLG